jgi:hypothetical protein
MACSKTYINAEQLVKTFSQGLATVVRDGTGQRFLNDAENDGNSIRP